jgi:hypothetical protein
MLLADAPSPHRMALRRLVEQPAAPRRPRAPLFNVRGRIGCCILAPMSPTWSGVRSAFAQRVDVHHSSPPRWSGGRGGTSGRGVEESSPHNRAASPSSAWIQIALCSLSTRDQPSTPDSRAASRISGPAHHHQRFLCWRSRGVLPRRTGLRARRASPAAPVTPAQHRRPGRARVHDLGEAGVAAMVSGARGRRVEELRGALGGIGDMLQRETRPRWARADPRHRFHAEAGRPGGAVSAQLAQGLSECFDPIEPVARGAEQQAALHGGVQLARAEGEPGRP